MAKLRAIGPAVEDARGSEPVVAQSGEKVSVRLWPCGAKPRRRLPFGPHP